jgi:hypothetical protein
MAAPIRSVDDVEPRNADLLPGPYEITQTLWMLHDAQANLTFNVPV